MENVINIILEIEHNARQKLDNAYNKKKEILLSAEQEEENIKHDVLNKACDRMAKVEEFEKSTADEKIEKIKCDANKIIESIDKNYQENHMQWEDAIFNNIVNQNHKS